jgi:hypothetical protein
MARSSAQMERIGVDTIAAAFSYNRKTDIEVVVQMEWGRHGRDPLCTKGHQTPPRVN